MSSILMTRYVLDSWAWIEYFEGSRKGERVKEIILDSRNDIFTHCVSVAEIISKAEKKRIGHRGNLVLNNKQFKDPGDRR